MARKTHGEQREARRTAQQPTTAQPPLPDREAEPIAEVAERRSEYHVTVEGVEPLNWHAFCDEHGIKPLYIELSDCRIQLMCETTFDPTTGPTEDSPSFTDAIMQEFPSAAVVRIKHEVNVDSLTPQDKVLYYEVHCKFDGDMRADRRIASRDLYRRNRWYLTTRSSQPIDIEKIKTIAPGLGKGSKFVEAEYEACIGDTNPGLDRLRLEVSRG